MSVNINLNLNLNRAAPIEILESTESTNTYLKALAAKSVLPDGYAVLALRQTGGRGRMGRSFSSPVGGLYLSMLFTPDCPPERIPTLTPCVAVAAARAIEQICGITPGIKWPNDLLLSSRKLCGILTESSVARAKRFAVVGLGINVNTPPEALTADAREVAVSLSEHLGRGVDLSALSSAVIEELDAMYRAWRDNPAYCIDEYRRLCVSIGRAVTLTRFDVSRPAYARDIAPDFALICDIDGREERITMGEVSLR